MGKPLFANQRDLANLFSGKHTQGSKTFQYLEEKRTIVISLVAASEKEKAQTLRFIEGGCKVTTQIYLEELQNVLLDKASGKKRHRW